MTARIRRGLALLTIISGVAGLLSTVSISAAAAASTRYEAEAATITQGAVESDHTGFTGTGFVNYDNVIGSSVQFAVTVSGAQNTSLNFRFANGTTTNRPMDIFVNGTLVAGARAFAGTGAWTTWQTATISAGPWPIIWRKIIRSSRDRRLF